MCRGCMKNEKRGLHRANGHYKALEQRFQAYLINSKVAVWLKQSKGGEYLEMGRGGKWHGVGEYRMDHEGHHKPMGLSLRAITTGGF